ncbi:MAG: hypothetical protein H7Z42_19020, partial [Roseiflexaceae bacterium]|nr:hypothetical protein [Roseiflexaceae bacterium]
LRAYGFNGDGLSAGSYGGGIALFGAQATGNTIRNCYLGTNFEGTASAITGGGANNVYGGVALINGASQNIIENNLISGNSGGGQPNGIILTNTSSLATTPTSGNIIRDNKIGVNAAGTAAVPNQLAGVYIGNRADNNIVGPGNVISGNGSSSISIEQSSEFGVVIAGAVDGTFSSGNIVRGNRIGLGTNGASIPNRAGGVSINFSQNTLVGGANPPDSDNPDRGNYIAGNNRSNVRVSQTSPTLGVVALNAQVRNNWIGLRNANTAADTANYGVRIERRVTAVSVSGNVIGGNSTSGIEIIGDANIGTPSNITISGNVIGPNAAGTAALVGASQQQGVQISQGVSNVSLSDNLITGNRATGVKLNSVADVTLINNGIGTLLQGNTALGNESGGISIESSSQITVGPGNRIDGHLRGSSGDGILLLNSSGSSIKGNSLSANRYAIRIEDGSTNNVIGYGGSELGNTGTADRNNIANNQIGISINGAAAQRNRISRTTATNNIDAGTHKGIVLSGGANGGISTPSASAIGFGGGDLTGTINLGGASCGGTGCTVEVFQNSVSEPNEGKFFLTSFRQNASGAFSVAISACQRFLTFTVTDQNNNTSAFSAPVEGPATCNAPDPGVGGPDLRDPSADVTLGAGILTSPQAAAFSATLLNTGSAQASFDLSVSAPGGWTAAPLGPVTLGGGASAPVNFSVTAPQGTPVGSYTIRLTATTSGGGASDFVEVRVIVPLVPALNLSAAAPATKPGGPNQQVCFTHTLSNQGNGDDTFDILLTAPSAAWAASITPASPVAAARGTSAPVTICVTVPGGTLGGSYQVNVQARSRTSPNPLSEVRVDTVQVQDAAVPQLNTVPAQNADPGAVVTFSHTLANIGNIAAVFDLALALPAGWTVESAPPATTGQIAPGNSQNFSYSVRVAAGAQAGPASIGVTATAQQGQNASTTVNDVVEVNRIASLALSAAIAESTEPPNSVVTYTLTLVNNGNFTDQISLSADASQRDRGWIATMLPATIELPAGQSAIVKLELRIPPGQPVSVFNTSTVTANSSLPPTSASASIRTNIAPVAGVLISPRDPVRPALAGESVIFEFVLLNSGSLPQTFTTVAVIETNTAGSTYVFTGTADLPLDPGQSAPLQLSVRVPVNAPDDTKTVVRISASTAPGGATATTLATVLIGPPYDVLVSPNRASDQPPGTLVQYTQYVTNTGRLEDSYTLGARSSLGWRATVSPASLRLPPGQGAPVLVTIEVPTSAEANVRDTTVLTARSSADPSVRGSATATTRVLQVAGAVLSPNGRATLVPGRVIAFQHSLLNSGNGRDTYTISVTQSLDWPIEIDYAVPPTRHPRGVSLPVQVIVSTPAGVPADAVNTIVVRATSRFDPQVFSEVTDVIAPLTIQAVDAPQRMYLPIAGR